MTKDNTHKYDKSKLVCNTYAPDPYTSPSDGPFATGLEFGWSVAINCDGSQVLVGSANDPAAVYLYNGSSDNPHAYPEEILLRIFHNPHGAHAEHDGLQSQFGLALAMNVNGERILIGDPALETVYLYDNKGHMLHTFRDPLYQASADFESMFGYSLAISDDGTVIAIGAPEAYGPDNQGAAGAVYLFHQEKEDDPTKWIGSEAVFKPGIIDNNDNYGNSIALSADGTTLLVGAWQANNVTGGAYLYEISQRETDGNTAPSAELQTSFLCDNEMTWFGYGWAVDLTENHVIIGAKGAKNSQRKDAGQVYVYSIRNTNEEGDDEFPLVDTIVHSAIEGDEFGGSLSATGNRVLVASYGHGTAYLYEWDSAVVHTMEAEPVNATRYFLKETISIPSMISTGKTQFFGASVALSRDGTKGVLGVPRALGKSGYSSSGTALGLCLPQTSEQAYSCPALQLPELSWKSKAFWFSWDSDSGKILAFVGTIILCTFILFYGTNKRRERQQRHRFQLVSAHPVNEYEMELRVIREDSEFL